MPSVIIRKKAILEFGIGLSLLIAIAICSYNSLNKLNNAVTWVKHTYLTKESLDALKTDLISAESSQRGYLLTGKSQYLTETYIAIERVYLSESYLSGLVIDNSSQFKKVQSLYKVIEKRLAVLRNVAELKESGKVEEVYTIVSSSKGKILMDEVLNKIREIKVIEDGLLEKRLDELETSYQTTTSIIIFGGVISIVIVFGAMTIINNIGHSSKSVV
ncbi:MAG: CHASE3 domain-containing protein [Brasilonema angustatum HA4187-MV1]|jgi:CHASE3 domain sensor protein|nr:CHASE3 domain-containing protein [Brasilonema angustatum HA4187-MV1]